MDYDSLMQIVHGVTSAVTNAIGNQIADIKNWLSGVVHGISNTVESSIASVRGYMDDILGGISGAITGSVNYLGDLVGDAIDSVIFGITELGSYIWSAIIDLKDAIAGVLDTALTYWGEVISSAATWIYDSIAKVTADVGEWIQKTWGDIKTFLSDQYQLVTTFWGNIIRDLYQWIGAKLDAIWDMFVSTVIPALKGALAWVLESEAASHLIALFEKHILGAFESLTNIDEEDLLKWIKNSFGLMKSLAGEIKL